MTELFTDEDKNEVNGIFDLLHDTFAKTITVFHDAKKTITKDISTFIIFLIFIISPYLLNLFKKV